MVNDRIRGTMAWLTTSLLVANAGCPTATSTFAPESAAVKDPTFLLLSDAFNDGGAIPARYTMMDGAANLSPPLYWFDPPRGTQSLALIVTDQANLPRWIMYNISPSFTQLPEGIARSTLVAYPAGAKQGINFDSEFGYSGPEPSNGVTIIYTFTLFALDAPLDLPGGVNLETIRSAMRGHVLANTNLEGRFNPA